MLSNETKAITRAVEAVKKAMNGDDFDNTVKVCGGLVYDNVRDLCNAIIEIAQTIQGGQSHAAHPVGSVYISVADTNPHDIFGFGEWELFAPGKTLVCVDEADADFNAAGKTGGAKTHTLTVAQMPAHTHIQDAHNHNVVTKGWSDGTGGICRSSGGDSGNKYTDNRTAVNQNTGGGQAHNNLQPYIAVYMWVRIA